MNASFAPRIAPSSKAAQPPAKPVDGASVTLTLSREEARVVASYLLASSVSAFGMADRAESALMMSRADDCRSDALTLCAVELRLRNAK